MVFASCKKEEIAPVLVVKSDCKSGKVIEKGCYWDFDKFGNRNLYVSCIKVVNDCSGDTLRVCFKSPNGAGPSTAQPYSVLCDTMPTTYTHTQPW